MSAADAMPKLALAGAAALGATALLAGGCGPAFVAPGRGPIFATEGAATTSGLRGAALDRRPSQRSTTEGAGPVGAVAVGVSAGILLAAASRRQGKRRGLALRVSTLEAPPVTERRDLSGVLPDCPRTIWNADGIDIKNIPKVTETAPLVVDAHELRDRVKAGEERQYFAEQRGKIMEQVQKHGAVLFRNFDLMKDTEGFRSFYEALQLNPCLDPIHTSGLREMVGKKNAVYEAVNKPSLAQHFVGLHNESTYVKTAMFGAFVCFEPASEGGGEFLLADGARIIADMDKDVLKRIYENKVRISVSNLDLNFIDMLPFEPLKESVKSSLQDLVLKAVAPKFDMDLEMIYGADKTNPYRLQAIEHAQPPINKHPVTGQPVWFCNLHNHSRYLRDRRPCTVPEVGMTDVYYGDLSRIPAEDVEHINAVCERNIVPILMQKGDVILLDNYRVLHGRQVFKGKRMHAVTWFESCGEPVARETQREKPDDFMNNLINKTLV